MCCRRLITRFLLILLAGTGIGCGKPGYVQVKGMIVHPDGSPATELNEFQLVFEGKGPDGKGISGVGQIDAQGRFEMFVGNPKEGIPTGTYKVLIEPKMLDSEREAPYPIDKKYRAFDTSGLTVDVQPNQPELKLIVEPAPAKKQ